MSSITLEIGASMIVAAITGAIVAFVTIKIKVAEFGVKIENFESLFNIISDDMKEFRIKLTEFEVNIGTIFKELNKIDGLKLQSELSEIKSDMKHIKKLLERSNPCAE